MNILKDNLIEVFSKLNYILLSVFSMSIVGFVFYYFTDSEIIIGNLGFTYFLINTISQILVTVLFSIFISISVYKYVKFSSPSIKEGSSSLLATFMSILVAGCPACSISVASYIGLAGLISFLPWYGLELKVISIFLLLYAIYSIIKDLNVCKIKKHSLKTHK